MEENDFPYEDLGNQWRTVAACDSAGSCVHVRHVYVSKEEKKFFFIELGT